jgi:uncharacterized protein (UPF0218 family)
MVHDKYIFGPSIDDLSLEAIYVIDDTYKGAEMVNLKRESLGLTKLDIVLVPTLDMNDSKRISSTAIRLGKIDRYGNRYADLFPIDAPLTLPYSLRDQLKEPFGEVVNNLEISKLKNYFLIAVGDIVVSNLLKQDLIPNLCIFDKISNREKITEIEVLDHLPKNSLKLNNAPGTINCATALKIEKVIQESIGSHEKFSIEISGEEDLLALPAMLFAPLDSRVIYGLKDEGAVVVTITEDLKKILVIQIIKKLQPLIGTACIATHPENFANDNLRPHMQRCKQENDADDVCKQSVHASSSPQAIAQNDATAPGNDCHHFCLGYKQSNRAFFLVLEPMYFPRYLMHYKLLIKICNVYFSLRADLSWLSQHSRHWFVVNECSIIGVLPPYCDFRRSF